MAGRWTAKTSPAGRMPRHDATVGTDRTDKGGMADMGIRMDRVDRADRAPQPVLHMKRQGQRLLDKPDSKVWAWQAW